MPAAQFVNHGRFSKFLGRIGEVPGAWCYESCFAHLLTGKLDLFLAALAIVNESRIARAVALYPVVAVFLVQQILVIRPGACSLEQPLSFTTI